jgi:hypothetical protein
VTGGGRGTGGGRTPRVRFGHIPTTSGARGGPEGTMPCAGRPLVHYFGAAVGGGGGTAETRMGGLPCGSKCLPVERVRD